MGLYIQSFLSNRTFRTLVNNTTSSLKSLENGIPQGSILSPTLFLIIMESLFANIPEGTQIFVFADDIVLLSIGNFPTLVRRKAQSAVSAAWKWAEGIGFQLSPEKSKALHFSQNRKRLKRLPALKIENRPIPSGNSAKILGITFDEKLTFLPHAKSVKKDTENKLKILRKLSWRRIAGQRSTLLKVANAWLVPKMLYGVGLFMRGGEKILKCLEPMYNKAIKTVGGTFVTSPTAAVMAESGQLPFYHLVAQHIILKAIRFLSLPNRNHNCPLINRAKDLFYQLTKQQLPPISELPRVSSRTWNDPPPRVNLSLLQTIRAGDPSPKVRAAFNQLVQEEYRIEHKIFTDGSVNNGTVGCGIFDGKSNGSFSLPPLCSIFSAEAFAMLIATQESTDNSMPTVICSDSASCLQALAKGKSRHPWIIALEQEAAQKNVSFCWIPGHCGVLGNERADRLAVDGSHLIPPDTPIPPQDARRWIKSQIRCSWDITWANSSTLLNCIKNTTTPWTDRPNTYERRTLTRLRIGHTRLTHSYLLDKTEPPKCIHCNDPLTIKHLLVDCPGTEAARKTHALSTHLRTILHCSEPEETNLINFLQATNIINQI